MTKENTKFLAGCAAIEILLGNFRGLSDRPVSIESICLYIDEYESINNAMLHLGTLVEHQDERDVLNELVFKIKDETMLYLKNAIEIISNATLSIDTSDNKRVNTSKDIEYISLAEKYIIEAINYCIHVANTTNVMCNIRLDIGKDNIGVSRLSLKAMSSIVELYHMYGFKDAVFDVPNRKFTGTVNLKTATCSMRNIPRVSSNDILVESVDVILFDIASSKIELE